MAELALFLGEWPIHAALAGGALLLGAALAMLLIRQPAKRQRLGEFGLLGALLVAVLCALPPWLPVSLSIPILPRPAAECGTAVSAVAQSNRECGTGVSPVLTWQGTGDTPVPQGDAADTPMPQGGAMPLNQTILLTPAELAPIAAAEVEVAPPPVAEPSSTPPQSSPWWAWLVVSGSIYAAILCWNLLRCVIGYIGLYRWWRASEAAPAHAAAMLAELTVNWKRTPQLRVSRQVPLPVSFGLFRPTILIPPMFAGRGAEEQLRWVLVHELTHLERRDAWSCLLLALAQAVYFFVPWFWWLRRQVRLCQEYVADAAAAALANSADYAQYLVSLSMLAPRRPAVGVHASSVLGNTSDLYRRIAMLLNEKEAVERRCPRRWTVTVGLGVLAIAVGLSGIGLRAAAAEPEAGQRIVVIADDEDKPKAEETPGTIVFRLAQALPADEGKRVILWLVDDAKISLEHFPYPLERAKGVLSYVEGDAKPKAGAVPFAKFDPIQVQVKPIDEHVIKWVQLRDARIKLLADVKPVPAVKPEDRQFFYARFAAAPANELQELEKSIAKMQEQLKGLKDLKPEQRAVVEKALDMAKRELAEARKQAEVLAKAAKEKQAQYGQWYYAARPAAAAPGRVARFGIRVEAPSPAILHQLDLGDGKILVVAAVDAGSPAAKAGIKPFDLLVKVAGKPVGDDPNELLKLINGMKADEEIDVIVIRKGKKKTIEGIKVREAKAPIYEYRLFGPDSKEMPDFRYPIFPMRPVNPVPFTPGAPPAKSKDPLEGRIELQIETPKFMLPMKPTGELTPKPAKPAGTTILLGDGTFELRHIGDGMEYRITGTIADGKAKVSSIELADGKETKKYASVDDVPGPRWEKVKNLVKWFEKASESAPTSPER